MTVFDPNVYEGVLTIMKCPKCRGEGKIPNPFIMAEERMTCYVCNGIKMVFFSRITEEDFTKEELKGLKKELDKWGTEFLLVKKEEQ